MTNKVATVSLFRQPIIWGCLGLILVDWTVDTDPVQYMNDTRKHETLFNKTRSDWYYLQTGCVFATRNLKTSLTGYTVWYYLVVGVIPLYSGIPSIQGDTIFDENIHCKENSLKILFCSEYFYYAPRFGKKRFQVKKNYKKILKVLIPLYRGNPFLQRIPATTR